MSNADSEKVFAMHRYFLQAHLMKGDFEKTLSSNKENKPLLLVYMALWYGLLHVTIEGWQRLKLQDPQVDLLLENRANLKLLKGYRDDTFHFQPKYVAPRSMDALNSGNQFILWIRSVHKAIGDYLLVEMGRQMDQSNGPDTGVS